MQNISILPSLPLNHSRHTDTHRTRQHTGVRTHTNMPRGAATGTRHLCIVYSQRSNMSAHRHSMPEIYFQFACVGVRE